jgi:tetratricopeptide (TPR) repeat protein
LKRDNLAFLIGGLAFGVLIGFGLFNAVGQEPRLDGRQAGGSAVPAPSGPMAPTQDGSGGAPGAAPMMAEINALKQRLQENDKDVAALVRLANIHHDVGMWQQAIGYYERALELRPGDPDLLTDMGICHRGTETYDRALELFAEAQQADPSHWPSLFNTAVVAAFDLQDFDRAEAALEAMAAMDPQPPRLGELRHAVEQARAQANDG